MLRHKLSARHQLSAPTVHNMGLRYIKTLYSWGMGKYSHSSNSAAPLQQLTMLEKYLSIGSRLVPNPLSLKTYKRTWPYETCRFSLNNGWRGSFHELYIMHSGICCSLGMCNNEMVASCFFTVQLFKFSLKWQLWDSKVTFQRKASFEHTHYTPHIIS